MSRYHKELGFPEGTNEKLNQFVQGLTSLRYSQHAKLETIKDRYHIVPVITKEALKVEDVFEIVTEGDEIVKAVFRVSGENALDNCYSISKEGTVVTCWTNQSEDTHRTLDASLYARA